MTDRSLLRESLIAGIFFLAGMLALGSILYKSVYQLKTADRYVTVKGLAERNVKADIAIWPISFKLADNDLLRLHDNMSMKSAQILTFLKDSGFKENEISLSPPEIKDLFAEQYYTDNSRKYRYLGKLTLTVHTEDIARVLKTRTKTSELVREGIALSSDFEDKARFNYTSLNTIKPDMIQQATANARRAALKFAEDSGGSKLGRIRNASQGQFVITDRDSNTPHIKKVRVVSTLQYYLID